MSLDKERKDRVKNFMDEVASLMSEHNIGLTLDGGLSVDGHPIGYLEQNYGTLDLLDPDEIPIYSAEIKTKS